MRRILRFLVITILFAVVLFGLFLAYSSLTCFNPKPEVVVWASEKPDTIPTDSVFTLQTWNIGYAGLGDNMDFFYDEGTKVRDTKERTLENLDSITAFLGRNSNMDFIFLQEVDFDSHRTYGIHQPEYLAKVLSCQSSVGFNYDVAFVPIPVSNPMGGVLSGVVTFSHAVPKISTRYQYPGKFSWPSRVFNLRRCMLVNRYPTSNGKELILINTHNSAFDDGSMKAQEMGFLKTFILKEYLEGNYVVVGGDWNQSPPRFPLSTFKDNYKVCFFRLTNIDTSFIAKQWTWAFDPTEPTNRYLNEPYVQGKNYTGILDFFLLSPNVAMVECKTRNLKFRSSDHNPVQLSFKLIK
ncbi:MAG: endonuclease/exonuclease/phosphatase family protein [Bacteroidales bacterium]